VEACPVGVCGRLATAAPAVQSCGVDLGSKKKRGPVNFLDLGMKKVLSRWYDEMLFQTFLSPALILSSLILRFISSNLLAISFSRPRWVGS